MMGRPSARRSAPSSFSFPADASARGWPRGSPRRRSSCRCSGELARIPPRELCVSLPARPSPTTAVPIDVMGRPSRGGAPHHRCVLGRCVRRARMFAREPAQRTLGRRSRGFIRLGIGRCRDRRLRRMRTFPRSPGPNPPRPDLPRSPPPSQSTASPATASRTTRLPEPGSPRPAPRRIYRAATAGSSPVRGAEGGASSRRLVMPKLRRKVPNTISALVQNG